MARLTGIKRTPGRAKRCPICGGPYLRYIKLKPFMRYSAIYIHEERDVESTIPNFFTQQIIKSCHVAKS